MPDVLTPEQRHKCMSRIQGRDTKPEMIVRSWLHNKGYRFRLHKSDLPGKPDIVLKKYSLVIFLNGCYWHRHKGCKYSTIPKTNVDFWLRKFSNNVRRDDENMDKLSKLGWHVLVIWECEVRTREFESKLTTFLEKLR